MASAVTESIKFDSVENRGLPRSMQAWYGAGASTGTGSGLHQFYFNLDGAASKWKPWVTLSQASVRVTGATGVTANPPVSVRIENFYRQNAFDVSVDQVVAAFATHLISTSGGGSQTFAGAYEGGHKLGRGSVETEVPRIVVELEDNTSGEAVYCSISGFLADFPIEGIDYIRG